MQATIEGEQIVIRLNGGGTFAADLERVKRVTGRRYDSISRVWTAPASPHIAVEVARIWDGVPWWHDDGFKRLLEKADRLVEASRAKTLDNLPTPPGERTPSWRHQRQAFWFAREHDACMLWISMGLGKTAVSINLICDRARTAGPQQVLVLCPLSVVAVWAAEFEKHAHPDVECKILSLDSRHSVARKTDIAQQYLRSCVGAEGGSSDHRHRVACVVINYESAWREPFGSWALKQKWGYVVADESHKLMSPSGKASRFAAKLRRHARRRLALTGTPMPRDPLCVFAQFRFLDPAIFGSTFGAFKAKYAIMGGYSVNGRAVQIVGFKDQDDLAERMSRITYRAEAGVIELPEATHVERQFTLCKAESEAYHDMERQFVVELRERGEAVSAANVLVKLLRLQQITCGFIQDRDAGLFERLGRSKEQLLEEVIEDCGKEPIAVVCHFQEDLAAVQRAAANSSRRYGEISGRRKDIRARWTEEDKVDVLGLQIQAGGLGIDLTHARYMVLYSLDYNTGSYEQVLARVHRPGQTRPVTYVHLVAPGTTDQKVRAAHRKKQSVVEAVRSMLT